MRCYYTQMANMTYENSTANSTNVDSTQAVTGSIFDPAWQIVLTVEFYFAYVVIATGIFGTAANATVLYALIAHYARDAKKRVINLLIINQNLLDLSCCLLLVISVCIQNGNVQISGPLGYFLCLFFINGTVTLCVLYGSIINLVAVTLERYLKVVHAIWSKAHLKRWMIHGAMAFSWIGGIATGTPVYAMMTRVEKGYCAAYFESPVSDYIYKSCNIILFFFFPLLIFIYCYSRIVVVIRRQMRVMAGHNVEGSSQMTASQAQSKRVKWNIIKTMIIVTVVFVICWLPVNLWLLLMFLLQSRFLVAGFYPVFFLVYINICINPFIYALKHEGVKQQLARLMVCCKPRNVGDTSGSNSNRGGAIQQTRTGTAHK